MKIYFETQFRHASSFLDRHPNLYKLTLISIHIFRAAMTYSSPMFTSLIILPYSLIYRVAVERSCPFRFTFASLFGAAAYALTKHSSLGYIPLTSYVITICKISNSDINKRITFPTTCDCR